MITYLVPLFYIGGIVRQERRAHYWEIHVDLNAVL